MRMCSNREHGVGEGDLRVLLVSTQDRVQSRQSLHSVSAMIPGARRSLEAPATACLGPAHKQASRYQG